jgi:hypothetical protein
MIRKMLVALVIGSCLALAGLAPAWAQDQGSVKATIPFAFNVGAKVLPAGSYEIRRLTAGSVGINNERTGDCAVALVMNREPQKPSGDAELVFNQYGESYFLSEVRTWNTERDLPMSKLERRAASEAAESASNPASLEVYVAALVQ